MILAPLQVKITPKVQSIDVGKSISLNCSVSGAPQPSIEWLHNGNSISFGNRIRITSKDVIHLNSVERKDRGMYQCVARNDWDFVQDSMQLDLFGMKMFSFLEFGICFSNFIFPSDDPPVFLHTFNDQTLNPGQQLSLKVSVYFCDCESNFVIINFSVFHPEIQFLN